MNTLISVIIVVVSAAILTLIELIIEAYREIKHLRNEVYFYRNKNK